MFFLLATRCALRPGVRCELRARLDRESLHRAETPIRFRLAATRPGSNRRGLNATIRFRSPRRRKANARGCKDDRLHTSERWQMNRQFPSASGDRSHAEIPDRAGESSFDSRAQSRPSDFSISIQQKSLWSPRENATDWLAVAGILFLPEDSRSLQIRRFAFDARSIPAAQRYRRSGFCSSRAATHLAESGSTIRRAIPDSHRENAATDRAGDFPATQARRSKPRFRIRRERDVQSRRCAELR